ncbi:MAG TPA: YqcI/YcgG family protein [Actinomycetota bacterium]|nr:YqcI/YcgG family protein [Actinomycetota bacterium]
MQVAVDGAPGSGGNARLVLTGEAIERGEGVPEWGARAYAALKQDLLGPKRFPCTFGVDGMRKDYLRYFFVEEDTERGLELLGAALLEYLDVYRTIHRNTSLLAMFPPVERDVTVEEWEAKFWAVLQWLHEHDPSPWPDAVPRDPHDPRWEFCYGGEPIFTNCSTPAHVRRRSRHADVFTIVLQPRWVFEGTGEDTPEGRAAREIIRRRLGRYDDVPPFPRLGTYGQGDTLEWVQYFLPDGEELPEGRCPLHISPE